MPHRFPRLATLVAGFALVAGAVSLPASAMAARPTQPSGTWIVTLRAPEAGGLPARRGGLKPDAAAIARDRAQVTSRTIDTLERTLGFTASSRYTYAMSGFAARLGAVQLAALRSDPRVIGLRRSRPVSPAGEVVPAGIERIGATSPVGPAGFPGVAVAITDTGVGKWLTGTQTWRHGSELNIVGGFNAYNPPGGSCAYDPEANPVPTAYDDTNGHGTHVAGTIGAADNEVGAVGVAPGIAIYSVRVFQGVTGSDETVICGLDWIASFNAAAGRTEADDIDAVNMSLRGFAGPNPTQELGCGPAPYDDPPSTEPEELAICHVMHTGAVVVVAAGNETQPVANYTPSRFADVITVAAISDFDGIPGGLGSEPCVPPRGTETDDAFSLYSNFGPEVDIAAPGTCVRSTDLASANGTMFMSGTSMATPHVTGAAARYIAGHASAGPEEVRTHLLGSATSDWDAVTDPDGQPDRLVDVAALVAATPDVAIQTVPLVTTVPDGTTERTVKVRLQRIGGYDGAATISRVGPLPTGVASVTFGNDGQIGTGAGADQRSATITFTANPPDGVVELDLRVDGDGGIQGTTTLPIRFDRTVPVIAGAWPQIVFRAGTWVNSAPVHLAWTATDGAGPLKAQELQRSRKGGAFSVYSRPGAAATGADASMERWVQTGWRIKATDLVGNTGLSTVLTTKMVPAQAQSAVQSPGWSVVARASAAASDLLSTTKAGATATLSFTGRAVAVVAPMGQGLGRFKVRIDGKAAGTVDLVRKQTAARRMVWVSAPLTPGPHTIKVVALQGRVELDAFLVLK